MNPQASTAGPASRWLAGVEWLLVLGLAGILLWTTLCLGGYLAETMVAASWGVFGLAAVAGLWWALAGPENRPGLHLAVLLPLPFLLYGLGSVFWLAPAKWLAWREWLLWFQMWLVFAVTLHVGRRPMQTWLLAGTFVALGLVGTCMAAYQRFVDPEWMMLGRTQAPQFHGRSAGMFGIPNSLAGLLELIIPACLVAIPARSARAPVKILCAWLALLLGFALVLTGSRGGWLGLGLAVLAWPLLVSRDWKRKALGAMGVIAVFVLGCWLLYQFSPHARERLQPFLEGRFEASRPVMWKAAVEIWHGAPWLGRGAAAYNVLFDQHRPAGFLNAPDWTHNDYLNTLCDYGVVGLALWLGAGLTVFVAGWAGVKRLRANRVAGNWFGSWRWKLGLLLGLLAFAVHLAVDFHTKIPALGFAAAVIAGLLLRDEMAWWRPVSGAAAVVTGLILAGLSPGLGWRVAAPLYRAEGLRFAARREIDRYAATGRGELNQIIPKAKAAFTRAVRIDPANGQAWSDLAYATVQTWHVSKGDLVALGRFAELAADEALARCELNAEFWVRKGVALDVQQGRPEAEACFRRAVELAPNNAVWWLYYARHLQIFPSRQSDALRAVETCLALDRSYPGAETLRQQLLSRR
jgi:O-antigen ligase